MTATTMEGMTVMSSSRAVTRCGQGREGVELANVGCERRLSSSAAADRDGRHFVVSESGRVGVEDRFHSKREKALSDGRQGEGHKL